MTSTRPKPSNLLLTSVLLLACFVPAGRAAETATGLDVVADLIEQFDDKLAANTLNAGPRGIQSSGRATHDTLYLHPRNATDATITYDIALPAAKPGHRLAFITWTCVLDTVLKQDKTGRCNGTRFIVRVNGKQVFAREQKPGNWLPVFIPLDNHAGKTIKLQLATNAINGNTNYDWAYWGEPRVMALPEGVAVTAEPVKGFAGLLVAPADSVGAKGAKLNLQPVDTNGAPAGKATEVWLEPAPGCATTAAEFDLGKTLKPETSGVTITAAAGKHPQGLRVLTYEAHIRLSRPTAGSAIVTAGQDVPLCVTLKNTGLGPWVSRDEEIWLGLVAADHTGRSPRPDLSVVDDPNFAVIDKLNCVIPAGEERVFSRRFKAPKAGVGTAMSAFIASADKHKGGQRRTRVWGARQIWIDRSETLLTEQVEGKTSVRVDEERIVLQSPVCRVVWIKLHVFGKRTPFERWATYFQLPAKGVWRSVAVCPDLLGVYVHDAKRDKAQKVPDPLLVSEDAGPFLVSRCKIDSVKAEAIDDKGRIGVVLKVRLATPDGAPLSARLTYVLSMTGPAIEVAGELTAPNGARLRRFCPISLRVADGLPTEKRGMALLPGLEYLDNGEPSSSTRDAHPPINNRLMPDPLKITVPMMMVSTQVGMVTLIWNPTQKWNGLDYGVSAAFSSPNRVHKQENHLMEVFVPTFPDYVNENERLAARAYEMKPGDKVTVSARVVLSDPGDAVDAMKTYFALNPPPKPARKQYDLQTLYDISRHGFLETVWYPDKQKSSHCVGWSPTNAPQFGPLLFIDSILAKDPAAKKAARDRAELIWKNTLRDGGPGRLTSPVCCHIMREDAPFYTGHIAAAVKQMLASARGQIKGRNADGVWGFQPPRDAKHESLGPRGYASQGIVARNALELLRKARITGDAAALEAGLKALKYHERFRVPHGAQGWECPIYEPDVLGSAFAVGAYLDAYEITGDRSHLDQAIYWAWTGMAFQYVWQAPDREQWMRYASIPVFGTTFYTHSWLGNPVQWCGLVYAYYLQKLAPHDTSFPWKRVAEGMTVSGEWLQFGDERPELKGSYPDGLYKRLTDRCPAMINPEDIIVNRYFVEGHDPRIKTVCLRRSGRPTIHISSCATPGKPVLNGRQLTVPLRFYANEHSGTVVANCPEPKAVSFDGMELARVKAIPASPTGWTYLPETKHLIVRARHKGSKATDLVVTLK